MKDSDLIQLQVERNIASIEKTVTRYYDALHELKRISLMLFEEIPGDEQAIDAWFEREGFGVDEDGFWQSLPLLAQFRDGKAPEDSISYSWNPGQKDNPQARFRMYCLRNMGRYLKEIRDQLPGAGWIYYQDVTNTAVEFPYIDQSTALEPDFDWSAYHAYLSVEPENNPSGAIGWTSPTVDYAGEGLIISISIPVILPESTGGVFTGLWSIDIPMECLYRDYIFKTYIKDQNNFIVNPDGQLLAHPAISASVDKEAGHVYQESVEVLGGDFAKLDLETIIEKESGDLILKDGNGQELVVYYGVIGQMDWIFFTTIPRSYLLSHIKHQVRNAFGLIKKVDLIQQIEKFSKKDLINFVVEGYNEMLTTIESQEKILIESDEAHQKSEKRLQTIIDTSKDAMIVIDNQGLITLFNSAAELMFGYRVADMLGQDLGVLMPDSYKPKHSQNVADFFSTGRPDAIIGQTVEVPAVRSNGEEFLIEISLASGGDNGREFVVGVIRDITERRQTELMLQKSEQRFRDMAELSPLMIYECGFDGNLTYINNQAFKIFNRPLDDAGSEFNILQAIVPEDADRVKDSIGKLLSGLPIENYEYTALREDGSTLPILIYSNLIIENDEPVGLRGVVVDITQHKQAEVKLAQTKEFLYSIVDGIPDPVFVKDEKHIWIELNDAYCKKFGYDRDDLIGKTDYDIFPKEQSDVFWKHDEIVLSSNEPDINEEDISTPEGIRTISTVKKSFTNLITGRKNIVGSIRDITEKKKAEQELKNHIDFLEILNRINHVIQQAEDAETMLSDVIEMTLSIFESDRVWLLYPCNPDAPEFRVPYESARSQYPGAKDAGLPIPMTPPMQGDIREALAAEGLPVVFGEGNQKPVSDDTLKDFGVLSQMFMSIHTKIGDPWMFGMHQCSQTRTWTDQEKRVFFEIALRITDGINGMLYKTELRESEKQLQRAQKMETVGILAGGIAHEFNNLLYIISGTSELLLQDADPADKRGLQEIISATKRGADLVKQLMAFSRKSETNLYITHLNNELKQIVKMLQRVLPPMIEIQLDLAENLPSIKADCGQIEQVVMNLCLNARDAMPDGGTLTIKTGKVVIDEAFSKAELPGEQSGTPLILKGDTCVILTISDTGTGMDGKIMEHIFDPFFTIKEIGKGTGLGLAVIYGIIKGHDGYIACESESGAGTTFSIYFPVFEDNTTKIPVTKNEDRQLFEGTETVLVVDDEESIAGVMTAMLDRSGYTATHVTSGEAALEAYAESDIDLVILDLGMPGMGGKKCLEKLIEIDPDAKVIVASGYLEEGFTRNSENRNHAFITKPFKSTKFLKLVREVLDEPA